MDYLAGLKPNGPAPSISPTFPGHGGPAYSLLQTWLETKRLQGLATDWGSYAALARHSDIVAFIEQLYGERGTDIDGTRDLNHIDIRLAKLWAFVDTLPQDGMFCLAAEEY
jgi:hypothetical protein